MVVSLEKSIGVLRHLSLLLAIRLSYEFGVRKTNRMQRKEKRSLHLLSKGLWRKDGKQKNPEVDLQLPVFTLRGASGWISEENVVSREGSCPASDVASGRVTNTARGGGEQWAKRCRPEERSGFPPSPSSVPVVGGGHTELRARG